jgi:hypothetical protein
VNPLVAVTVNTRRKTLKTSVLLMSKKSAPGRSSFCSPKVGEVPTVRSSDTVTDLPTFHKL